MVRHLFPYSPDEADVLNGSVLYRITALDVNTLPGKNAIH